MVREADDPYRKAPQTTPSLSLLKSGSLGTLDLHMRTQEEISGDLLAGNLSPAGAISLCGISESVSLPARFKYSTSLVTKRAYSFVSPSGF